MPVPDLSTQVLPPQVQRSGFRPDRREDGLPRGIRDSGQARRLRPRDRRADRARTLDLPPSAAEPVYIACCRRHGYPCPEWWMGKYVPAMRVTAEGFKSQRGPCGTGDQAIDSSCAWHLRTVRIRRTRGRRTPGEPASRWQIRPRRGPARFRSASRGGPSIARFDYRDGQVNAASPTPATRRSVGRSAGGTGTC